MQGGPAHRGAGQGDGFKFGHRRDHPRAAHLATEAQQFAGGFFSGVFQGDRPAGCFLGETCGVLQAQVVEFHHHAVGGVGQLPAASIPLGKEGFDGGEALAQLGVGVHLETCRL